MKDPLDREERPYEILGVSPEISAMDAEKAYGKFLRVPENAGRRQAARVAYDRLRRIERRVEDEIFYYPSAALSLEDLRSRESPPFSHDPVPPRIDMDAVALAKHWPAEDTDFDSFSVRKVQVGQISIFEERLLMCLPIEFPR